MTRTISRTAAFILLVLLVAGCDLAVSEYAGSESSGTAQSVLPPDQLNDTLRSGGGAFSFETLYPVELNLGIVRYEPDGSGGLSEIPAGPDTPPVYVTVEDPEGNILFSGASSPQGIFASTLYLPSAPENAVLTLRSDGFETRSIVLDNTVRYERVERTMSMMREQVNASMAQSAAGSPRIDSDGDGVPDRYDLFPEDPAAAFSMSVPPDEHITVAFEDLFGHAAAGDADYNDFIGSYTIDVVMNGDGMVTAIEVHAQALQKLAGYNHAFGIRIDDFAGGAWLSGYRINRGGFTAPLDRRIFAPAEIILFENTAQAVGKEAHFKLEFAIPQDPGSEGSEATVSSPPYNPYLYVYNTRHDIHLIDAEPLKRSINPDDDFIDEDGFPWALLIPVDWEHPAEGQRIEIPYPTFTPWRESGGELYPDWYLRKGEEPNGENLPPYPVISGDPAVDPSVRELTISLPPGSSYQLAIDLDSAGRADPNGDAVVFESTLPVSTVIYFDYDTGILTNNSLESSYRIEFWSKEHDTADQLDTRDDPLILIVDGGGGS
jgi:LruC domain-containing protein